MFIDSDEEFERFEDEVEMAEVMGYFSDETFEASDGC